MTGFQAQRGFARCARFLLEPAQHRLGQAAAARRRPRVHAFDLRVVVKQRNAAACDGGAVEARHEKAHVRFKQLIEREPVALVRLVGGVENAVEFADEVAHVRRRLAHTFDGEIHGRDL